ATAEKPAAAAPPVEKPAAVPAPAEKPAVAAAPVERPAAVPASAEAGQPQKDAPAARQAPAMPVENEASMPVAATSDDTTVAATSDVKAVPRQDDRAASFARTGLLTPSQAPAPRFADAMPANAQVQPSATNQIANALASALTDMSPSAGANGADRTRLRAGGAALKTIQIQLAPEQLGKVNVTLKLIEGNLSVHIEAMEPDTASRLKDDAEGLKALLKSAGFDVDDAMITLGSREGGGQRMGQASSMPGDASASGQPRGEGSAGGQSAHGGQSGQRDPSGGRPARPEPVLRPNEAGAESGLRHMGLDPSVYL
ncbi:flagellar hook-length control protein FliK, partial [Aurantimonas sp. 22II-16-19i]|uniref:flagellar hook-length control protein FliK n=1 Tax=Aurantimonas sp. 22II-16-19i TaxID=1317114 RepID=UPI0009F7CE92